MTQTNNNVPMTGSGSDPLAPRGTAGTTERLMTGAAGATMVLWAVTRPSPVSVVAGAAGAVILYNAARARSPYDAILKIRRTESGAVAVRESITIGLPREQVYDFWRDFTNLPRFMTHLEEVRVPNVQVQGEYLTQWTARAPGGTSVSWEAELTADEPGRRIAWKSTGDAQIPNEGEVLFRDAPGDRGTEVHVHLKYEPPGGTYGAGIARMLGEEPSQQIRDDLRRLKRTLELGEVPTTNGQTSGRPGAGQKGAGQKEAR